MISDFYKPLTWRHITIVNDGLGGFNKTQVDSSIQGYISYLSAGRVFKNQTVETVINAMLFCGSVNITKDDIIIDQDGKEFIVIECFNFFHKYYQLAYK